MNETLYHVINSMADIPDEQWKNFEKNLIAEKIRKNQFFIKVGEIPGKIGFIVTGLFHYYYINNKGKQYTKQFCPENHFIIPYSAMLSGRESNFYIQALEDSNVLITDHLSWKKLFEQHLCWRILTIKMLEKVYLLHEKREKELLLDSAETRYLAFLKEYPGLEQRLKQYHIASYLGITPVALSRIRTKILSS